MKKSRGFSLVNILISISIALMILTLGYVCYRDFLEQQEIKRAKVEIYELFTTYSAKAFNDRITLSIKLDYLTKEITVYKYSVVPIEIINLPKNLKYATIFDGDKVDIFTGNITKNGNITPSFSVYIFDYDDIAQYRISFYGFDILKYMKINIYRNRGDKTSTYSNILTFHKKWSTDNPKWEEE